MSTNVGLHVGSRLVPSSRPPYAPSVLDLHRDVGGWDELVDQLVRLPQRHTDVNKIETWGARIGKEGEHDGWGVIHHPQIATADDLMALRHHKAVIGHAVNRAVWAYLACLPPETWVAVVYS